MLRRIACLVRASNCRLGASAFAGSAWRSQHTDARGFQRFGEQRSWKDLLNKRAGQVALGGVLVCGGVYAYSLETVPFTHRTHSVLMSANMERQMGAQLFEGIKKNSAIKKETHPSVVTVRNVAKRLIRALEKGEGGGAQTHLKGLNWEFIVVESPQVNAFVCPGGKVVVFTGLMDRLRSKDELAAVLAHEIGHTVARHGAENATEQSLFAFLRILVALMVGLHVPAGLTELALTLPHSRRNETEADAIGLELLARACFRPEAMISVFKMLDDLEKASGAQQATMCRTHPLSSERVRVLQEQMPRIMSTFELSGCTSTMDAFSRSFG